MSKIYISSLAPKELYDYFKVKGHSIEKLQSAGRTYMPVDTHPDMFICKMGVKSGSALIKADIAEIGEKYPENIRFNAVCTEKFFMHSLKYTSSKLIKEADLMGLKLIDVNQGYTKCNTVVVDDNSVITSDVSVFRAAKNHGVDVLMISKGFVNLSGFEYGFLGGASGRVDNEIVFCGNLSVHPDFNSIARFIYERDVGIKYFSSFLLTDIGSIIQEN